MSLRIIALLAATVLALSAGRPAAAECAGTNLFEALPDEIRAETRAIADADPYGTGLFWKATKGDGTIYIVGTAHTPDPVLDTIAAAVMPALSASDRVFFEVTEAEEARFATLMTADPSQLIFTEPPTLDARIGAEAWAVLERQFVRLGIDPNHAKFMRPWIVGLTIATPICMLEDMKQGKTGLDVMLRSAAAERDIPVAGLDDAESLLSLFTEGTLDEQVEDLRFGLLRGDFSSDSIVTTLALYAREDTRVAWETQRAHMNARVEDAAERALLDDVFLEFEDRLLRDRNEVWVDKILAAPAGQTLFVAVGAMHLATAYGVPALLAEAGWTLERLPVAGLDAAVQQ